MIDGTMAGETIAHPEDGFIRVISDNRRGRGWSGGWTYVIIRTQEVKQGDLKDTWPRFERLDKEVSNDAMEKAIRTEPLKTWVKDAYRGTVYQSKCGPGEQRCGGVGACYNHR